MSYIPYGYQLDEFGHIIINQEEAETVLVIFCRYYQGYSLGKIVSWLSQIGIPSPSGKDTWGRATIDKLLSNEKYCPYIIPEELFQNVQQAKEKRTNMNKETNERRDTRYYSSNELSGLIFCSNCEKAYRRITCPSGEVIWRCANRVENGKKSECRSMTISDNEIKDLICKQLGMNSYNPKIIREEICTIQIGSASSQIQIVSS